MRELAVQASNDYNSDADRAYLQDEVAQLAEEITRISQTTQFNGQNILDGSYKTSISRLVQMLLRMLVFLLLSVAADSLGIGTTVLRSQLQQQVQLQQLQLKRLQELTLHLMIHTALSLQTVTLV